jgi:formylglycine-generating enzyme required for sulfatase activity
MDWSVKDGILTSGGKFAPQYLFTKGTYRDFHLRAEVKVSASDNSGVFFRMPFADPVKSRGHGAQLGPPDLFNRGPGMTRTWPFKKPTPLDRWFVFEQIARERQFTVKFDGETVVDVVDPEALLDAGHIAVEQFSPGTQVQFRKIEIKELPSALTAEEAKKHHIDAAKALSMPVTIENSLGMKLNLIPAGKFLMGSPENEPGRNANESPQHEVTLTTPYYMGTTEVTVGQFRAFVTETGYKTLAETNGKGAGRRQNNKEITDPNCNWKTPGFQQTDEHPAVCIAWQDAVAFCEWLSRKEGKTYRLPREAEWEHACRNGSRTAYFFGSDAKELGEFAWWTENTGYGTSPVGRKRSSSWWLFDMLGNVWEWCLDDHRSYGPQPVHDPVGSLQPSDITRSIRGGSFHPRDTSDYFRSAHRYTPWRMDTPIANLGFRVVRELPVSIIPSDRAHTK